MTPLPRMTEKPRVSGLYAIADTGVLNTHQLGAAVTAAIRGGAHWIQYRDKSGDILQRRSQTRDLLRRCRAANTQLIINDDVELAAEIGAHGVHLGQADCDLAQARRALGDHTIIGVSCYNRMDLALVAEQAGADYIAFGRFFASSIKPDAVQAAPALLAEARKKLTVPVVAIGGINIDNAGLLITTGAQAVAVISALFTQPDIESTARVFTNLFYEHST